jgi:hypothetical protein
MLAGQQAEIQGGASVLLVLEIGHQKARVEAGGVGTGHTPEAGKKQNGKDKLFHYAKLTKFLVQLKN